MSDAARLATGEEPSEVEPSKNSITPVAAGTPDGGALSCAVRAVSWDDVVARGLDESVSVGVARLTTWLKRVEESRTALSPL